MNPECTCEEIQSPVESLGMVVKLSKNSFAKTHLNKRSLFGRTDLKALHSEIKELV